MGYDPERAKELESRMLVVLFAALGVVHAVLALDFWWSDDLSARRPSSPDPLVYRPVLFGALAAGVLTVGLVFLRDFFTGAASLTALWLCVLSGLALPALIVVSVSSDLAVRGPAEAVLGVGGVLFLLAAYCTWKRRSASKDRK